MRKLIAGSISSIRRTFRDTFDRADSASLGTASDGSLWNIIRGAFSISGNSAVGDTADYPMATVTMPNQDASISLSSIGAGSGAALWVTDSGNWWAVGVYRQAEDCDCVEYYNSYTYTYTYTYTYVYTYSYTYEYLAGYNAGNCAATNNSCCSSSSYCCGTYNTSNCCGYTCYGYNTSNCCGYTCYGYNAAGNCKGNYCSCYNGSNCQGNYCSCYNGSNCNAFCNSCNSYSGCNNCIQFNQGNAYYAFANTNANANANADTNAEATGYSGPFYNCGTCYPSYLRILQSVGNTVSTIVNQLIGETAPQSMKVLTSGNQITAKVYSDTSLVTQIGSDIVYTATGAAIMPAYGITVSPSSYSQSYSIGEIYIEKN